MNYLMALVLTFVTVFLKGLQHKNVIHNLYVNTFFTSYLMAFMDVLIIGLIAKSGWDIAFASGTGGALGMVAAMYLHNRYMKPKEKDDGLHPDGLAGTDSEVHGGLPGAASAPPAPVPDGR
jgi:hypothetical protein